MNKRIQAMAASHFPRDTEGNIHATPEIIGEFAELIVRECLTVINQPNGVGDDDVIRISEDVKKHFGVEE